MAKPRLVVMIPTRNRPGYLALTVKSVLQQARLYRHDLQIVVSDQSDARQAEHNEKMMRKLQEKYGLPVHYYPPGNLPQLEALLKRATPEEKSAFNELVPEDGHWGAHRNRLTLLAAMYGGQRAAYLHLDDDTPIMQTTFLPTSENREYAKHALKPNLFEDVLERFLESYAQARRKRAPGIYCPFKGVEDASTSHQTPKILSYGRSYRRAKLALSLAQPFSSIFQRGYGSGRVLSFRATAAHYKPRGRNEDLEHTWMVERTFGRDLCKGSVMKIMHIGLKGSEPPAFSPELDQAKPPQEPARAWTSLARKAALNGREILRESARTRRNAP